MVALLAPFLPCLFPHCSMFFPSSVFQAQNIRQFFTFGHELVSEPSSSPSLQKEDSLYANASDEVVVREAKLVVERATFLITLAPMHHRTEETKQRWAALKSFAASARGLDLSNSEGAMSPLVKELMSSEKLKALMAWHRRKTLREKKTKQSATEQSLRFLMSKVKVLGGLENVVASAER